MTERNYKFMQSLGGSVYRQLSAMADERGISIQELIRAVIVPEWLRLTGQSEARKRGPDLPHDETSISPTKVK